MALLSGRALTATELAELAGVSRATATEHLQLLSDGRVITVVSRGRHRFHRLASTDVADVLEALARLAPPMPVRSLRQSKSAAALAAARTCYDHIAGRLGVDLYDGMLTVDVMACHRGGLVLGANRELLDRLGVDLDPYLRGRRPPLRDCLDWTERRPHLGGGLAAAVLASMLAAEWITRTPRPRALALTQRGQRHLEELGLLTSGEAFSAGAGSVATPRLR